MVQLAWQFLYSHKAEGGVYHELVATGKKNVDKLISSISRPWIITLERWLDGAASPGKLKLKCMFSKARPPCIHPRGLSENNVNTTGVPALRLPCQTC